MDPEETGDGAGAGLTTDEIERQDILPDELLSKHLDGAKNPKPAAKTPKAAPPAKDNRREATPAGDADDNLDDDAGDDEPDDELDGLDLDDFEDEDEGDDLDDDEDLDDEDEDDDEEDDLEDEDEEDDEEDDVLDSVPAEEIQRIKEDPALRKLHKHMQRAFTKKTEAVARRSKELERRESELADIRTPKGIAEFLTEVLGQDRNLIGVAFETVATGEGAENFLVEVALQKPEVFEKAYDRFRELNDDPDELDRHKRKRDDEVESRRVKQERRKLVEDRFEDEKVRVGSEARRYAKKLGIDPDDYAVVNQALADAVRETVNVESGRIALDEREVRKIVKSTKEQLDKQYERAAKRLRKRQLDEKRETVRKRSERNRRGASAPRSAARGSGGKGGKGKGKGGFAPPEGVDGLDAFIDTRLKD